MKNRAKCKLCSSIIESLAYNDYIECACGEIAIGGGEIAFQVAYKNAENFLRVDDEGNEIVPKFANETSLTISVLNLPDYITSSESSLPGFEKSKRSELIEILDDMIKRIENLPQHAIISPITHADFAALMVLLSAILKEKM